MKPKAKRKSNQRFKQRTNQKLLAGLLIVCLLLTILPVSVFAEDTNALPCDHTHTDACYEQVVHCVHQHTTECYPTDDTTTAPPTESDGSADSEQSAKPDGSADSEQSAKPDGSADSEQSAKPDGSADSEAPLTGGEAVVLHTAANQEEPQPTACTHVCTAESGCITTQLNCPHTNGQHDATCNYALLMLEKEGHSEKYAELSQTIKDTIDSANPNSETMAKRYQEIYDAYSNTVASGSSYKWQPLITEAELQELLTESKLGEAFQTLKSNSKIDEETLQNHIVSGVNISHATVNLFDYWLYDQNSPDTLSTISTDKKANLFVGKGINRDTPFFFSTGSAGIPGTHFNRWTGSDDYHDSTRKHGAHTDIVNSLLKDGYPTLNPAEVATVIEQMKKADQLDPDFIAQATSTSSLAYLFDPTVAHDSKASYENVEGLFQIDDQSGSYYYSSLKNFAEFDERENKFILYDKPAVKGNSSVNGQFFPFNTGSQVFDIDSNQNLSGLHTDANNIIMNHYFGLTLEIDFQQPRDGTINHKAEGGVPMTFSFTGDDDVWIFIDGVLVSDLGGIHDTMTTTIDFKEGTIITDRKDGQYNKKQESTLKEQFEKARKYTPQGFQGDTFANGTSHELKLFYLERGNHASNLELSFNLIEPRPAQILKLDQDGQPLQNVTFALYEADDNFTAGNALGSFTTDENGFIELTDGHLPLSFREGNYLLKETKTLPGYVTTGDLHLVYDEDTGVFTVANRWETGAIGGFEAQIYQAGPLRAEGGSADLTEDAKKGLILAVPNLKDPVTDIFYPMYGSVLEGFHVVKDTNSQAALEAALRQITDPYGTAWYLDWIPEAGRFEGLLQDLPGAVDRYIYMKPDTGDIRLDYYLLSDEIFAGDTAEEKISDLKAQLKDTNDIQEFAAKHSGHMQKLDISDFTRQFYTRLYIPNKVRELRILKQDENGQPLAGAEFTLYQDKACTQPVVTNGVTATGITDQGGMLTFSAQNPKIGKDRSNIYCELALENSESTAPVRYWLKETKAPVWHAKNTAVTEVCITANDLYVNAGTADNNIAVRKGLGQLLQTMTRYASDGEVNVTLRDITAFKYTADETLSGTEVEDRDNWTLKSTGDAPKEDQPLNLHYGLDSKLIDYGLHEEDEANKGRHPYFETKEGWLGLGVQQNYDAHGPEAQAHKTKLVDESGNPISLSALFTGTTTVVVTDEKAAPLTISKTVSGNQGKPEPSELERAWNFTVALTAPNGETLASSYDYTGSAIQGVAAPADGTFILKDGIGTVSLKHGQSITIEELPIGTVCTITEQLDGVEGYTTKTAVVENGAVPAWKETSTAAGTIQNQVALEIRFNNEKDSTQVQPPDPVDPTDPPNPVDPTDPPEPTDPPNPTDPEEPGTPTDPKNLEEVDVPTNPVPLTELNEPENPHDPAKSNDPQNPTEVHDPDTPATGDQSNLLLFVVLLLVAGAGLWITRKKMN